MPEFSERGYELPLGSDPIASGDDVMRANFMQIDGEITALESHAVRRGVFSGNTDSTNGIITVTAAQLGLSTVTAAVASVEFSPAGGAPMLCAARTASGNVQVMIFGVNPLTNGTLSRKPSTSVTVSVIAWGTV